MSRILIPVDYSLACHNAYRFGLQLAQELELDVVLTHYYSGALDPRTSLHVSGDGTIYGNHLARLRRFAYATAKAPSYPPVDLPEEVDLMYEVAVRMSASAAILERAREEDISVVVMAPRSSTALLGKWLGSTATTVSEACDRPVYIVPSHCRYAPFRRMVVANNQDTADPYPLWQLQGLAEYYGAKVHFVHVHTPGAEQPVRFVPWDLMEALMEREVGVKYPFNVVTVTDSDISNGLIAYAEEVDADLIVIVNQTRTRWTALLQRTLTQDLVVRSRFPVLVLHRSPAPQAVAHGQEGRSQAY
ncbi:hypothetical protein LEM8419_01821 [Neolewinella maritima]|uniref:UspA domain-containing protein n=1 Tax=Neolewinella maritima TaxID=1383882 RepID=A0ABN8F6P3_9BACT|nr:universal stress protein [Neolewinella maritima]CAH1000687.1 hypothetical protein LEM8419_01821 [Neolewinella maritima]